MTKFEKIRSKIGYQALFEEKDFFEGIDFALDNGFRAMEANLTSPNFYPERYSPEDRSRIKEYSEEKGIDLLLHAPEGLNFLNPQKLVREALFTRTDELVQFSHEIGAKRLTFHLGYCEPLSVGGKLVRLYQLHPRLYEDMTEEVLTQLTEIATERAVLCLENCGGFRYGIVQKVMRRILPSGGLWLTWDLGHTNRLKGEEREEEIDFYSEHLDRIGNCHLHDNSGDWDEHNVIGAGTVDFVRYLRILADSDAYFIFEVRPRDRALVSLRQLDAFRDKLSE